MVLKPRIPLILGCGIVAAGFSWQAKSQKGFEKEIKPILAKHCLSCHQGKSAQAGIDFSKPQTATVWFKAEKQLSQKTMPPPGAPAMPAAQRQRMAAWIKASFKPEDCDLVDPGRVTMRRLNRSEYDNTIRDLLLVDANFSADFPNDDVGYGFDNIGDVLSISPLQMEKYLDAAEKAAAMAIQVPLDTTVRVDLGELTSEQKVYPDANMLGLMTNAELTLTRKFETSGTYKIRVEAGATQAGDEPAKMAIILNKKRLATFDVLAVRGKLQAYEVPVSIPAGTHRIGVAFLNDYYEPVNPNPARRDRNLYIGALHLVAPPKEVDATPRFQKTFFSALPEGKEQRAATAKRFFKDFARRAYRRPADAADVEMLMRCYGIAEKEGQPFEMGIRLGIQAALISPNFLFRVEPEGKPLTSQAIASRLSYFLWSTTPDAALSALADSNELVKPGVIAKEVSRMMKDPKARALGDNFAAQWLQLRKLASLSLVDPEFNPALRDSMIKESTLFFQSVVKEDRSVIDFLSAKYSFVNEPLAKIYGILGVTGTAFRKVNLEGTPRSGILTQAAILAVTSNPTRTSPVKRGKWILEEILGTPPPPPPPGVDSLDEDRAGVTGKTLKQRLESHRKKPACATCHAKMDALGFGFENFDPIGRWRTTDRGLPIDAGGVLPDGSKFTGSEQLRLILLKNKDEFVRCLSEKLLTYAIGRGLNSADDCAVDDIVKAAKKNEYKFSSLIAAIALSDPFLKRTTKR